MRVALITESFLPTISGVTTSVCKVLAHLARTGHDAILIAPAGAPSEYAGFPVYTVPAIAYRQFPVGLPSPQVQRLLAHFRPDVVHAASPFLLGAQGIAAANRLDIPAVAIFQTDVAGYAARNRLGQATALAWRYVKWVHEGAARTLVPSSSSMTDLSRLHVPHLALWRRGVDLVGFHPNLKNSAAVTDLRKRIAPNNEVIVGYVGRMAPEKQVERLRALRGLGGISVALVGDGPSEPQIARALAGMPVTWLGRLHGAELAQAYASFDIFVHAGTEETFGQTLQEANAAGIPVIAPDAGGPLDLVTHGENGYLFIADDERDLRRQVQRLVRDPALRNRMGEAGRRTVLGRSWTTVCDELLGHYEGVLDERAAVRALTCIPLSLQR
ncbi:glycosyltransferase family 1 protein [Cryobacterium sp. CG_9.6]|uniref:glycosyltransferase family 4 protein n=1 Tax=Cryobacterium sp. CG_9.6 TaxID=2760710 RepID=UPI00247570F4|nr:glycosyltransferase family 1 protein [Cryobacterium sp. CG_9.6]MDH6235901.1 phosphatidylinositol alpha 1,6-mannosyltransferase [Cryobacterium sp. CG_9.6]